MPPVKEISSNGRAKTGGVVDLVVKLFTQRVNGWGVSPKLSMMACWVFRLKGRGGVGYAVSKGRHDRHV